MSILEPKHVSEIEAAPARRVEIFTGAGRRRTWTAEKKRRLLLRVMRKASTPAKSLADMV